MSERKEEKHCTDSVKCNITFDVGKNLFYAVSALHGIEFSDESMNAILEHGSYNFNLSDIGITDAKFKGFMLGIAGIILAKQLEKEKTV